MHRYFSWYDGDGVEQLTCCVNQKEVDALFSSECGDIHEITPREYFSGKVEDII